MPKQTPSMHSLLWSAGLGLLVMTGPALAGDVIVTPSSNSETKAFVGLNWTFGSGASGAEGVIGAARVSTDAGGDSNGAKLSVHMNISGGLSFSKVKVTGMTGQSDAMGEIGLGFGTSGPFATGGLWLPYVNAGVDLGFGGGVQGYAGVHTLDAWNVPTGLLIR